MKFIHISDLHYHRNNKDNKAANKMMKKLKENYADHYLIVTGDIADDGHEKQFENAYKALAPFKGRVFIAPGNHDFGAKGNFYSKERAHRFDEMLSLAAIVACFFPMDPAPITASFTVF